MIRSEQTTYHISQLIFSFCYSLCVTRVYHENKPLGILIVMTPQWPNFVLTTNIPYSKTNVFVLDCLHVKSDGRYCGHDLSQFKLIKYSSFPGGVESNCNNNVYSKSLSIKKGHENNDNGVKA